jgi:hypothetical protein
LRPARTRPAPPEHARQEIVREDARGVDVRRVVEGPDEQEGSGRVRARTERDGGGLHAVLDDADPGAWRELADARRVGLRHGDDGGRPGEERRFVRAEEGGVALGQRAAEARLVAGRVPEGVGLDVVGRRDVGRPAEQRPVDVHPERVDHDEVGAAGGGLADHRGEPTFAPPAGEGGASDRDSQPFSQAAGWCGYVTLGDEAWPDRDSDLRELLRVVAVFRQAGDGEVRHVVLARERV